MWAQLIKTQLKPGREGDDLSALTSALDAAEQPGSGLLRSTLMRDQSDPSSVYFLVVFESEERARQREQDERRSQALEGVRAMMADLFVGPPDFVDLVVEAEHSY